MHWDRYMDVDSKHVENGGNGRYNGNYVKENINDVVKEDDGVENTGWCFSQWTKCDCMIPMSCLYFNGSLLHEVHLDDVISTMRSQLLEQ